VLLVTITITTTMMLAPTATMAIPGTTPAVTLTGRSRAGEATAFYVPELRWLMDCGATVTGQTPRCIFVTHTHGDHVQCLAAHVVRSRHQSQQQKTHSEEPVRIYLPAAAAPLVEAYLQAHQAMIECGGNNDDDDDDTPAALSYELCPCVPGQELAVYGGGRKNKQQGTEYIVQTIECVHRIDCLGYSIFRPRPGPLLEAFQGLPGVDIGRLRKQGVTITGPVVREPVFCFLGDTTQAVFVKHPELLQQHHCIVVECTFLTDTTETTNQATLARAVSTKHMHWDHLRATVEQHPHTLFVLIHFSLQYADLHIRRFFLPWPNVHAVLIESQVASAWHKHPDQNPVHETEPPVCTCFQCQCRPLP